MTMIQDASSSPSLFTSRSTWKYDVFISFRGEDTRKTFVDHLYHALKHHGICTYKDDVTLDRGDTIGPALLSAIRESQISVVIFSENYADSSWCLDELSSIMKCNEEECGQIVIPIFYNVDPSDVRKQKRKYEEAFAEHQLSENNKKKVETWKKALVDASNIAGWETKHVANGHEAKCIKEIVGFILDKLSSSDSIVEDENLVGMGTRLQQLRSQLRIESGGVRIVGIWGLGGAGKTTLAISLYKQISSDFDGCCFLGDIREISKQIHGLQKLQEKLLSTVFKERMQVDSVELGKDDIKNMLCRRKVLIVLDDVDHLEQLEALAGCQNWFGNGSRLIITTRDEQVLTPPRVDEVCPVTLLSDEEAIRLFKRHAYQVHNPVEDYEKLSLLVITYANRLPLALKILGAFLYGKNKDEWLSTLDRLKDHPEMGIVEKLKISYDGLKDVEKELFLDIACFHNGRSKDDAMEILDACGFYPVIGVKVLVQKALIIVSNNGNFDMHDLVEEMAHYIVRGEHPNNPEKHSRIWREEDIEDICSRNATMENDKIEAIQCYQCSLNFIMVVSNMKKLRFLKLNYTTSFDEGPSFLSNELRYISWPHYPASPFPESFQPTKLVVLSIPGSLQKELWKGYKCLPCLKVLKLVYMKALVRTPNLRGLPCLQKLIIERCESLEEIHQSLGKSLVFVKVKHCYKLTRFPSIVGMEKLETLIISRCGYLTKLPNIESNMDNLVQLRLKRIGIEVLPSTIGEYCTNLTILSVQECEHLRSIDDNYHDLKGLKKLKLKESHGFVKLLKDLFTDNLYSLGLRKLDLGWCGLKDGNIPSEIAELFNLQKLDLMGNDFTRLDFSLRRLISLKLLVLSYCEDLVELPELPSSLAILSADNCHSLEVIKDDVHRRCKWLCEVSLEGGVENTSGTEKLLETMLQGNAVKSEYMILRVTGSEIPRGFEPRLVRGDRCRMQLSENWYNHYSGFLFCATADGRGGCDSTIISMKHVEKSLGGGSLMGIMGDSHDADDMYWEEEEPFKFDLNERWDGTLVTYLPFSLLRHTSWWNPTSTAVEMKFHNRCYNENKKCGLKLVPKGAVVVFGSSSETTPTPYSSSFDDDDDDYNKYKCTFQIVCDSKSVLKCAASNRNSIYVYLGTSWGGGSWVHRKS